MFIETGGECQERWELFHNSTISVPTHKYVQGNFWKLNIAMYNVLMQTLHELINKNLKMRFDLQDLFNYYIFIQDNGELKNINILGNNIRKNTINGLGIWSENRTVSLHPNVNGLNNLYYIGGILSLSECSDLISTIGLGDLTYLGGLSITECNVLVDLIGFENIESLIGSLAIDEAISLQNLQGFESLNYIGGNLVIRDNDSMSSLEGLNSLTPTVSCFNSLMLKTFEHSVYIAVGTIWKMRWKRRRILLFWRTCPLPKRSASQ